MLRQYIRLFFSLLLVLSSSLVFAQSPRKPSAAEIYQSIQKLNFLGTVLYVAAHPDDENTRLISWLSNHVHARTVYLSLTRGDGGQNLIGPEMSEQLGVIRTHELLEARKIDGGEQFFSRANDFGFSKVPEETLEIWDKDQVLADVVWTIRKFRPDVIINRFDHRTRGTTHGHHTAASWLSLEAFDLSDNPHSFSEQLAFVQPWQPERVYFNTSWWFYGSQEKFKEADKSNLLNIYTGLYDPGTGLSNGEVAALSRSMHRSQGFGTIGVRGEEMDYLELVKGDSTKGRADLFEGINTTWSRVKGGEAIGRILYQVADEFDFRDPSASIPALLQAYGLIALLEDPYWREHKLSEIREIIAACAGLFLEAVAAESYATPGAMVQLTLEAINRSPVPMRLEKITIVEEKKSIPAGLALDDNNKVMVKDSFLLSTDKAYTSPYWLSEEGTTGMYVTRNQEMVGLPVNPLTNAVDFTININGVEMTFTRPVVYKQNDPAKGETYKPFEVVPAAAVRLSDEVLIFPDTKPRELKVFVKSGRKEVQGNVSIEVPQGWKVTPASMPVSLSLKGEEQAFTFTLTPPLTKSEGRIIPKVTVDGRVYSRKIITIDYDHIPFQTLVLPASGKVVKLDIQKLGEQIGYIEGAGDVIPGSLEEMGYRVTIIKPEEITASALAKFDAIVIGIRAFNTVEQLKFKQAALHEYVHNGGTLIVQYMVNQKLVVDNIAPYPITLSRERVTEEHAAVNFLAPDHPVLNTPNKITSEDFEGWVQERGLYFASAWDEAFTPILSAHDQGEPPRNGGMLVANYGKGYYIYSGYSWFRQFPAGVAGAYRIFANMVSLGKTAQ
jgi:LmbE family N-acetylglucosaminyl deacetylase